MFSLTEHVLVTVINEAAGIGRIRPTFDDIQISALYSIRRSRENIYSNQRIVRETYNPSEIKQVFQAYGKVGMAFETHAAFFRTDLENELDRNATVSRGQEVVLIKRTLLGLPKETLGTAIVHRILPDRIH